MTRIEYLRFFIGFINPLGTMTRVFTIIPEIIQNIRQTGFFKYLKKTFKDNLKGILVGSIMSLQSLLISYYCGSMDNNDNTPLFGDIGIKNKIFRKNFLTPYIESLKTLGEQAFAGTLIGLLGADEEITFRKYFQKILEDNLKIPIEKALKKMFILFKTNKMEQKISMIYLFIESTLNGIVFGLYHIINIVIIGKKKNILSNSLCNTYGFSIEYITKI